MKRRFSVRTLTRRAACALALIVLSGCGLVAPLPDLATTLTLEGLRDIQRDPRLTADDRRAMIRDLLGLPDDANGNRIADFLRTLNITLP
ncbi:MAG: hypothetical protein L6Q92_13955 [Phycisphaerae bacterium]|nr:hypothetical protein [Phycisphaerae bacterium]